MEPPVSMKLLGDGQTEDDPAESCLEKPGQAPCNFEDVITAMGPPGRFQIVQCLLLSTNFIPLVLVGVSFVFIALEPPFTCAPVNETNLLQGQTYVTNDTGPYRVSYEECEIKVTSNASGNSRDVTAAHCLEGYSYHGGKHVSLITEWDLVCDYRGTAELARALPSLGSFLGFIVATMFSDKFGRKITMALATAMLSMSELGCFFAPNIYVFTALRCFAGVMSPGVSAVTYVIGAEHLVSKYREQFTMCIGVVWSVYAVLVCAIAYILRNNDWRDLQLCAAISGVVPLVCLYFVDESASWLYSKGRYDQATRIIKKSCRINGLDFNEIKHTWDRLCAQETKPDTGEKDASNYNMLDIFRSRKLRVYTFIAWTACLTNDTTYYGMFLSASRLAGDLYLNTTLMTLLDIPGCLITLVMLKYKGRRFVMILFMSMAAICLILSTCLSPGVITHTQHITNASIVFFLLGRFAIGNSFQTLALYIPEIFPTTLRSSGLGLCATGACVGGMLAPYVNPLHGVAPWAPGASLVAILTFSVVLMFKLPESKGKQLPSTINEG